MVSPFPGMDPYLEHPDYWPECHHRLVVAIADALVPLVRPKYEVAIEKRIYEVESLNGNSGLLVGIPDVSVKQGAPKSEQPEQRANTSPATATIITPSQPITVAVPLLEQVKQGYLEVREVVTRRVITAIELLSPANKRAGDGRNDYLKKRNAILNSTTHLVELDLLRDFVPMPLASGTVQSDYRVLVSRGDRRPHASLYAFSLWDTLPIFPLPLQSEDSEPLIELPTLFNQVYDRAGFDYRVNYRLDPPNPLSQDDRSAIGQWLRAKGL